METNGSSQWYTLQVMSGQENRVGESLRVRSEKDRSNGNSHGLDEVMIPTVKVVDRRDGKSVVREVKSYPGYVFVKTQIFDEFGNVIPDNFSFIKDTRGVIKFMGGDTPLPLSDSEVAELKRVEEDSNEKPKPEKVWKVGDRVKVKEGAFENFEGVIESVDEEHHRLEVSVSIFGRSTICETDYWQVDVPDEPRD